MDLLFKVILATVCIGQVHLAPRTPKLSVADSIPTNYFYSNIEGNPGVYSFNYDVSDDASGNTQYRTEDRYANGTVAGAYGYVDAFGAPQRFRYVADQAGYRLAGFLLTLTVSADRVFRDSIFKPFIYGHYPTTLKPFDKVVVEPTESSVTWTRPKRPKNKDRKQSNKHVFQNGIERTKYNLIGPPSQYVAYD